MNFANKRTILFWGYACLTIAVEALIAYWVYQVLLQRGYVYTFRVPVSTDFMSYNLVLLFCASLFSLLTLGIFRKRTYGEVETTLSYLLSYFKHPIPLGSVLLLLYSFLFL